MARNKIIYGNETLIDLSGDTAKESDVSLGKIFHKADGSQAMGMAELKLKSEVINETLIFYDTDFYTVNLETVIVGNRIDNEMFTVDL